MKVIVIDDSRLARNELKRLLKEFDIITVEGEAANAIEAKERIEAIKPDLIFLDIQMPGKDGFELLQELEYLPEIVFTTAYDQYALRAFEFNALDYLQKPIEKDRLAASISRVGEKIEKSEISGDLLKPTDQVFVKDGDRCWFIQLKDVELFEVDGNYTKIYFEGFKPMVPRTLNYLESRLDPRSFFRTSRQQIINLKWIKKIEPWFSGSIRIYLKGGQEVDVSRRQTQRFKELMSI